MRRSLHDAIPFHKLGNSEELPGYERVRVSDGDVEV